MAGGKTKMEGSYCSQALLLHSYWTRIIRSSHHTPHSCWSMATSHPWEDPPVGHRLQHQRAGHLSRQNRPARVPTKSDDVETIGDHWWLERTYYPLNQSKSCEAIYVYNIYILYYLSYAYYILYIILFCKVATPAKRTKVFWTKSNTVWIGCCGAAMPCRDGLERSGHLPLYGANSWHLMTSYDPSNCTEAERFPSEPVMCCGRSGSWKEVGSWWPGSW